MADEKRSTPGAADGARRRRPAPTIDLTAREVQSDGAAAAAQQPPRGSYEYSAAGPTRDFLAAADSKDQSKTQASVASMLTPKLPYMVAGLAGAALVVLLLFGLWLSGLVPIRYAGATAMRARVAGLELQVRDLSNRPPAALDGKAIDELKERLAKIEQAVARLPAGEPAGGERLAAVENALKALGIALAALNQRADGAVKAVGELQDAIRKTPPVAERGDLDALQPRIAALERAAQAKQDKADKTSGADSAARLALAAATLRDAVLRGEPYAGELAAMKALGGDAIDLAPLEPFAAAGVPSDAALARELTALVPAMLDAAGAKASGAGGFFERLQANAGNLVRIRPVDEPPGNDPAAVLARLEIKAAQADVVGAQAELAKLPAKARALAEGWSQKVAARNAAIAASRKLAADSSRALGKP
jgi:hypothetical protein